MAIAFVSPIGTVPTSGTTTVVVPYPANLSPGNLVLCGRTVKPSSATAVDETGWTALVNTTGGTGTSAADTGPTRGKIDYRFVAPGDTGSITFDQGSTPNSVAACMIQYSKTLWSTWSLASASGDDTAHGTGRSATSVGNMSLQAGDVVLAFVHSDTDDAATAYTTPLFTATGMTFGTYTFRLPPTGSPQGNDSGLCILEAPITAGATANVTVTISLAAGPTGGNCGITNFVRLREVLLPVVTMPPRISA